jgi:hypothetical protein
MPLIRTPNRAKRRVDDSLSTTSWNPSFIVGPVPGNPLFLLGLQDVGPVPA